MATLGSLFIDLRANTAKFIQDLAGARGEVKKTSDTFGVAQSTANRFAQQGLGAVADVSPQVGRALDDLSKKSSAVGRSLAALGVVLAGKELFQFGFAIGENIRHLVRFGETVDSLLGRLKEEAEAEKEFAEQQRRSGALRESLAARAVQARLDATAAIIESQQDEIGAAQIAFEKRAAQIEAERQADRRRIVESITDHRTRAALLVQVDQASHASRLANEQAFHNAVAKIREAQAKKQLEDFVKGTQALLDEVERRNRLREDIESRGAAAAGRTPGAEIVGQLGRVNELRNDARALSDLFAKMVDDGIPLRDLFDQIARSEEGLRQRARDLEEELRDSPAALAALQAAAASINFQGLTAGIEDARARMRGLGIDAFGVEQQTFNLARVLGDDLPAGIDRSEQAVVNLIIRFQQLRAEMAATARQAAALAAD